jgi:hypothetical protein
MDVDWNLESKMEQNDPNDVTVIRCTTFQFSGAQRRQVSGGHGVLLSLSLLTCLSGKRLR